MAETKGGVPAPRDAGQLRLRLQQLEAEAEQLRAVLGEPRQAEGPSDAPAHVKPGQVRPVAKQYRQIAAILDASADAIISIDDRGLISRFNRGAEVIFGYRSSEIIGRPLDILIPDRFRKNHRAHMMKFDRASEASRLMNERGEIFGLRKGGQEFPAEASIVRLNADGRSVFTVIMRDITERKAAEAALREREAQLRQAQKMARIGSFVWDESTDSFEYCSDELAALLGYTPEAIVKESKLGNWVLDRIHPDDRDRYAALVNEARETAVPYDVEFQFLHNDGYLIHLREMGEPELDADGRVVRTFCTEQDITHIRQAEEFLRQSEGQLRQAQRLARLGAYVWDDVTGLCVDCSDDMAALFGMSAAQFVADRGTGPKFAEFVHADDRDRLENASKKGLAGALSYEIEYRAYDTKGDLRHFREIVEPITDENGRQIRTFGTVQDITHLRRAENALRQTMRSGDLLRQIATAANEATSAEQALSVCLEAVSRHGGWHLADVFVLADDDSGVMAPAGLWWADGPDAFTVFRRSSENIHFAPGKGLPGRVAETGKPAWIADVCQDGNFPRASMAGGLEVASGFAFPVLVGQKVTAVLEFFSRDIRECDDNMIAVALQAGTVLGRVIERQRAARALRDSEEHIRLMTDNVPILITYIDQKKTFSFVNKTTEEWYGRPASELIGIPLRGLVGKAEFAKMEQRIDRALGGETLHFAEKLAYPDGMTRHIDATYVPHFEPQGKVRGIFTMVVNVTDRIQAEEQLRHAQKMEAVGKLTGGVAHDFNNLLAVIMGNSEIIRDRLGEDDPAVRAITSAAKRGADLTQRLLSFSRQQPLRPRATNLAVLTREIAGTLTRTLGETIAIEVKSPSRPWSVRVDAGELENAILNLAINARDAMPAGGTLTIETNNVTLDVEQAARFDNAKPGKFVCLSVTDTGEGMSAEVLDHAFEPFYTTKPFGVGSGLGLSMVYGFATQSGGFATIESRKGKGATINLYLPRTEGKDEPDHDGRPLCAPVSQGGSIMVVEDDPDVRRLSVTLLSAMGYTVHEAEDGESALAIIMSDRHIDLLLSDVVLPGDMSGPAIAEAALERRPDLRVMFMSGYAEDVIRRDREGQNRAIDADLLTKPFTRAQLARKVTVALGAV